MIYYLCLVSNLKNPVSQLDGAIQHLENDPGIKFSAVLKEL